MIGRASMIKLKLLIKPFLVFVFLVAVAFPTFQKILRPGFFPMHDDIQPMRVLEMNKCIMDLQIPCRWVPDMGYGYGYPQFNYYGPLPYYMMEAFHLGGLGYLDSVKAGLVIITLISVFGMYLLGKSLWGEAGGLVSAVMYTYAPYRALDFFVRGDISELTALAAIPFLFWSVREILLGKKKAILWFALATAGLVTSHNISTLIFTPVLGLWALYLYFSNKKELVGKIKDRLIRLILGGVWGVFLGAFFLIPAWFEKSYAHVETLLLGYFNYLAHYVSIKQLLFSTYWNYGSSESGVYDEIFLGAGLLHWVLPLLAAFALWIAKKKKELYMVAFLLLVGWLALFMSHERSTFIWNHIPLLAYLQFPWRFVIIATFVFSLAAGSLGKLVSGFRKNLFLVLSVLLFSLIFYASYFHPSKWLNITDKEKFSGASLMQQETVSIFDYLPIYAKHPPGLASPNKPVFVNGEGEVKNGEIKSNKQSWEINVTSENSLVELPSYYFPNWKVYVDGGEAKIDYSNELGLIRVNLNQGDHKVDSVFTNTPVRTISNIATIIGLALIPAFFLLGKKIYKT